MTITIARYALWILLCIPVAILGFSLFGDLSEGVLQESRSKKEKKDAQQRKEDKRRHLRTNTAEDTVADSDLRIQIVERYIYYI